MVTFIGGFKQCRTGDYVEIIDILYRFETVINKVKTITCNEDILCIKVDYTRFDGGKIDAMSKFLIGAICGFLACVWAIQTTPLVAFTALVQRLEEAHKTSANANEAYNTLLHGRRNDADEKIKQTDYP